jgi:hypothetical protein
MKVYQPQARVLLIKARRRESLGAGAPAPAAGRHADFAGADITRFLADEGGLRTAKSVRDPVGGFSLVLRDQPLPGVGDSAYALIEPMDVIEIRMAHERSADGSLPLVMRGLVSTVSRSETIVGGQPQRLVTVTGQDFGKILQILRVYFEPGSVVGDVWLDAMEFFRRYDPNRRQMSSAEWLMSVAEKVLTPYMQRLLVVADGRALGARVPREMQAECSVVGTVSPLGISKFEGGSTHELLAQSLDVGPFNELYVEDRENSVALVCRPAPWRRLDGSYVEFNASAETVVVDDGEVMAITVSRSDSGVANFFWVNNTHWNLVLNAGLKQLASRGERSNYDLHAYENSRADLYGLRKMEAESQLGGIDGLNSLAPTAEVLPQEQVNLGLWLDERRRVLAEANRDNAVLESGSMRLRGRPDIRAGMYVELVRRGVTSLCYAVRVEHEFVPGHGFFTNVEFERGTGYVARSALRDAPWVAEMNTRGVR